MVSKMEQYDRHLGRCYTSQDPWIELARRGAVGVPRVENMCEKGTRRAGTETFAQKRNRENYEDTATPEKYKRK